MNIKIVKSLTHRLCRMFGHFYGELWKLEEKKEIEVVQLLKDLIKSGSNRKKTELSTWGSTGQPIAGDRGPLLPVRPLDKAPGHKISDPGPGNL